MLHIEAKIHDRFTLEFKVGYSHDGDRLPVSDFLMNTWVFVPDALYINPKTYPKSEFYRDVRSQVRLMTPVYGLHELVEADAPPFVRLEETCVRVVDEEEGEALAADLEHQLKMLACVVRSALRSRVRALELERDAERLLSLLEETLSDLEQVERRMRRPFEGADRGRMPEGVLGAASVADRYVGAMALYYLSRLSERLYGRFATCRGRIEALLGAYFDRAAARRAALGQPFPAPGAGADAAGAWLDEVAALRREVEHDLYLEARKRNNTFVARQVAFMVAAGLSMVFATLVSFSFQQTYGNFTLPLFVALVVSYMMKDRIKDLLRYWFANRLGSRFYDYRTKLDMRGRYIGLGKEGFDYVSPERLPDDVRALRRAVAGAAGTDAGAPRPETVLLYRRRMLLLGRRLADGGSMVYPGVNEILRFGLGGLLRRVDNPHGRVAAYMGQGRFRMVAAERMYRLIVVVQFRHQGRVCYKRYRVALGRRGLHAVDEV